MLLQLSVSLKWRNHHHHHHHNQPSAAIVCSLSKKGQRLLSSIDSAGGDSTISHRLIRKFVASSSKSVALNTLSHLLSSDIRHHSSLSLPMYEWITEASWFEWNPKLISTVIASLENQGQFDVSEKLISDSVQKLASQERELALFYCNLINSYSKYGSKKGVFDSYNCLKKLLSGSSSLNRQAYESMINGLCILDLPHDAEEMMEKMRLEGFKPSDFEFRSVVLAYGRLGLLNEMRRVLDQMENSGYTLDTISSNIVLSSYGANKELSEMVVWIKKMKNSNVPFSVRTYNSVLNSCPTIMAMLKEPEFLPLSIEELIDNVKRVEGELVQELIDGSSVLLENLKWDSLEGKLDLHGMHLGTAYVILLEWMDKLKSRFHGGGEDSVVIPAEIRVVYGLGKHSSVMGKSPVKALVSEMMVRLKSPMRIGRKNDIGSFVGKGKAVRDWLCPVVSNETLARLSATRALE
ncbi:pentatricopeptide repeat-containing protein At2g17033-like [Papaver somniferum]|uniref:pentatricopeptide repeat-containing protein At2g17033-like n=1 Tax=Papaver somniferum TaxID=3469 RepID=UPI000E6F75CC|nr:pentatricopeptide repeat-containing protein At2g17033-like [Papaver somniferum]XP_026396926.1 pentatricopeptide repeat-containing protein At2g17033-like [Papaver somniferum]XP_026396932.1 pentatricopeptide repeat-containing protein At2g17033-like [Papaver somniferum]XP_026396939.1 pentatricopeptide repeat-containing protein At2g17033-like [Papaver somniferum]